MQIKYGVVTNVSGVIYYIKFVGENTATTRIYPKLSSYTPKVNDKVAILYDGFNYLIIGKID